MKENIINNIKFIVFGTLVVVEILIFLVIALSLEGELLILFTIGIILIPILIWLGNIKTKL
ncbi:hypothetical protein A2757_02395 [Candidatus Giovannonibacteria bacterium RIFCSPHIGHO2_01_FULL_48_47]|nr:MAG: hypothetical protein A2757_02395 [Candidatus Giovannonibacteria bacterium RIFCSPHIGHO2_01_FULL_48_47]OGF68536.1 MAG: hypothetical protein A3D61_02825 [Candidatus Giovannonibacteria bacterium RIFCSPHIGHO2_02_FULL_48_15]OGF88498.1 MAG: hypothetical protein A3B26_02100 [Candidatus Giovannonibacteria bacterium RIFCSPLOWO2_01_FULL_48_47]OGF95458.1 MAG: hypothetical protein A2433_00360 [Candidatus Giovannonibacteria bacterium RIFOXYC1_FULL_48_8]OGF96472.1 MAG: hypothetical protein A2613_02880